jgi:hypothetical protein
MDKLVKVYTTYKDYEYYYISMYGKTHSIYKGYNKNGKQIGQADSLDNSLAIIKSMVSSIYKIEMEDVK